MVYGSPNKQRQSVVYYTERTFKSLNCVLWRMEVSTWFKMSHVPFIKSRSGGEILETCRLRATEGVVFTVNEGFTDAELKK